MTWRPFTLLWLLLASCGTSAPIAVKLIGPHALSDGAGAFAWQSTAAGTYLVGFIEANGFFVLARGTMKANQIITTTVATTLLPNGASTVRVVVFADGSAAHVDVPATHTVIAAQLAFTAARYGFLVPAHTASAQTLAVANMGNAAATFASLTDATLGLSAPFSLTGGTCAGSLAAGETCTLIVTYAPRVSGSDNATLDLPYDDSQHVTAQLAGMATSVCDAVGSNTSYAAIGSGTTADPYVLCTSAQLVSLSFTAAAWANAYVLGADIDLTDVVFSPIGQTAPYFSGAFDGAGHTISHLTLTQSSFDNQGFFARLVDPADIRRLTLADANVSGHTAVGLLAGSAYAATILDCHTSGSVTGTSRVGGLLGDIVGTVVSTSSASTIVTASGSDVGGLIGISEQFSSSTSFVYNSFATGAVQSTGGVNAGGLFGSARAYVFNSYASGDVTANQRAVGGFAGAFAGTLVNDFSTGAVSGNDSTNAVGVFIGLNNSSTLQNCFVYLGDAHCTNSSGTCTSAGEQADATLADFTDPTHAPLSAWDFANVWVSEQATAALPALAANPFFDEAAWGGCAGQTTDILPGRGTPEAPYLICTPHQLANIAGTSSLWSGAAFKLMQDLDLSQLPGEEMSVRFPIAKESFFFGLFDGNGKRVENLVIADDAAPQSGLFGAATAIIRRLGVVNASVTNTAVNSEVGAIAGTLVSGVLADSYSTGAIDGYSVGGLCGHAYLSVVTNNYSLASVTGVAGGSGGGLVGDWGNTPFMSSFAVSTVNVPSGLGGALAGDNPPASGFDSYYDSSPGRCPGCPTQQGTPIDLSTNTDYFFSSANPPLSDWNFTLTWQSDGTSYPTLR